MSAPPYEVVQAILNGQVTTLRSVELYESDGTTLWLPAGNNEPVSRLTGGTVNADYGRDERRSIDLSLDNTDNALRSDPYNGLWYDKVIKAYRGIRYVTDPTAPPIAIIYEDVAGEAVKLQQIIQQVGYTKVDVLLSAATADDLDAYEIIVSHGRAATPGKTALLAQLYAAGKKIVTTGDGSTSTQVPLIAAVSGSVTIDWGVMPVLYDTPVNDGWTTESVGTATGVKVTGVRAAARVVARYLDGASEHYTGIIEENVLSGGRWFHYHPQAFGTQSKVLLKNALTWLWNYTPFREWTTQIGEFVIDNIAEDNFPYITKVSGRDLTKKCITSNFETSTSFSAGTPITDIVKALAANAGITKFNIPASSLTTDARIDVERNTPRWDVMRDAASTNHFRIFFDAQGYLTMRPEQDPSFAPVSHVFQTGMPDGDLIKWSRSTSDARLYNHVIVTGESSEEGVLPFFGEARNTEPSSPTRIARIGDRAYFMTSTWYTSNQQCIDVANTWLKLTALESYDLGWDSLVYPWMDVGDIVEVLDPRRSDFEPIRFLLDNLTIPLELSSMSATGKRVTIVQDTEAMAIL